MSTVLVDSKTQRFTSGSQPAPEVVVEHTTEVMAWPPYANGGEAPHATIWPIAGQGIRVREHIPFTQYAKALMNLPGGVETNRRGVIQFELVGTCNPAHRGDPTWYYWPDADDVVLAALADYQRPIMQRFGIPFTGPAFLPYPASYGKTGVRMSGDQWTRFKGVCGHQHVPENDHGDPGAFPIGKFLAALRGASTQEVGLAADDVQKVNDYTKALLLDGYTVGGQKQPSLLDVLVETQRRVSRTEAALSALSKGLGPQVEAAVRAALEADYDATVQLKPKGA